MVIGRPDLMSVIVSFSPFSPSLMPIYFVDCGHPVIVKSHS